MRLNRLGNIQTSFLVELFVLGNLVFLALDVYLAHSANAFSRVVEWVPVFMSLVGPAILVSVLRYRVDVDLTVAQKRTGMLIGFACIVVGLAGMILHLEDTFFRELSLKNLVYIAPFAAPLAYAGLGFLILLNRMVDPRQIEWGQWVVFFCLGGFVGNFALSLCDHAQNGFFYTEEWIPVIASAVAVGFLAVALLNRSSPAFLGWCMGILVLQMAVGGLGFFYHARAIFTSPGSGWWVKILYSAPLFAPLLFVDLALLGLIGLWDWRRKLQNTPATSISADAALSGVE